MTKILTASAICVVSFVIIDGIWLTLIAKTFYRTHIGFLLAEKPNWWAAAAFYLLFLFGLMVFVVVPALLEGNALKALYLGALFGLVTYATYDLTNHATVKDWPFIVTAVDLCWGSALAGTVSFLSVYFTQMIFRVQP